MTSSKFVCMVSMFLSSNSPIFLPTTPRYPKQRHNSIIIRGTRPAYYIPSTWGTGLQLDGNIHAASRTCQGGDLDDPRRLPRAFPQRLDTCPNAAFLRYHRSRWLCIMVPSPGHEREGWAGRRVGYYGEVVDGAYMVSRMPVVAKLSSCVSDSSSALSSGSSR